MMKNGIVRQRTLDDLSNEYDRFYLTLPSGIIDEMTYLDLTKVTLVLL